MANDRLTRLLWRVRAQLGERGNKEGKPLTSQLAADIGARAGQVWEWLNGKYLPNGEVTLTLLEWVEKKEHAETSLRREPHISNREATRRFIKKHS